MKHLTREEQARRLYQRTYYTALFAMVTLGNIAALEALRAASLLRGDGGGMPALSLVWLVTAASIATRRVRRAGLSREARATEFFHGAGARAQHALRQSTLFEVRSQPSKLQRAATYFFCAVWMAVMSVCVLACWSLLHDPDTSLPFKITMAIVLVFCPLVPLASVAFLYLLAFDPPDFRADSRSLRACHGLWFRTIRWEQVETMEIIATHNLFGELARLQPRFKDARGKTILLLNLSLGCTPEARDSIVSFLRAACSEHEGGSSTCEVIGAEVGV